jgi:hypothetical protein
MLHNIFVAFVSFISFDSLPLYLRVIYAAHIDVDVLLDVLLHACYL